MRVVPVLLFLPALLAACSSRGSNAPGATSAPSGPRVIEVTMTDDLRYQPAGLTVSAGETIRFEITNAGQIRHEFFIGDEDEQAAHEDEMREMGGMAHDEPNGVAVDPGQTKSLEHTFRAADSTLIGCHEPGHYDGGMVATVTVEP